jgi:hypothetical protein
VLNNYLAQTQQLLQNPAAPTALYSTALLTGYINVARGQIAAESESIRRQATISLTPGSAGPYNFSSLALGTPSVTGVQGAIHIRSIFYAVGSGQKRLNVRAWEWFEEYSLNTPVPQQGAPVRWSQYQQGGAPGAATDQATAAGGSFYVDPVPDIAYTLSCDCVCFPLQLAADGDPEALPYLWTDCVPFFASYFALLSSQTSARRGEAEAQFGFYQTFLERARRFSNPNVNRFAYAQTQDPAQAAKIGLKLGGGNGAQ